MEHLGRWLKKNAERRFGTPWFALGMLSMAPAMVLGPATATFGMSSDPKAAAPNLLGLGALAAVGWIPFARFRHRRRNQPDFQSLISAHIRGLLVERLGVNAPVLEEAATEAEQIVLLSSRSPVPKPLGQEIAREANLRMERMVDLAAGSAANHGFTRDGATAQIEKDSDWLARTRETIERATLRGLEPLEDPEGSLIRLRELASEREAALQELRT
ncbi:hypothetical protein EON81_02695 [bacterium]|nr:MAG: hypothetical protein EON81_02695 [bacterium]